MEIKKTILITGVAGFIGSFLAKKLLNDDEFHVIGIDNINDYYDINLKLDRINQFIRANTKKNNFVFKEISINDKKAKKLGNDLNSIFSFIEKLNELNTKNTEPLTSIVETTLKLRKDEIKSENIREDILKNSPDKNKDFFVVPKVVE